MGPTHGRRVVRQGQDNLALIRSGQDWSGTTGRERLAYLTDIQPVLEAGMHYLRDEGLPIGCLACRYMAVVDEAGVVKEQTYGLAHFDSLTNLERGAKSHLTHLAIFNSFMQYAQGLDFPIALGLYHEVAVVPADRQRFESLNCHSSTGLLASLQRRRTSSTA